MDISIIHIIYKYQMFKESAGFTKPQTVKIQQTVPQAHNCYGVSLIKGDSFTTADALVKKGYKTLVLNFANNDRFCNGTQNGRTQEEDLARRSNLFHGMSDKLYPISQYSRGGDFINAHGSRSMPDNEPLILSTGVSVFKNRNGDRLVKPFQCDVATIAALSIPKIMNDYRTSSNDYEKQDFYNKSDKELTRLKIEHVCKLASNYDAFVAGAWGLGAFSNPDFGVINIWNSCLEKYHAPRNYFPILGNNHFFKKYLKTGKFNVSIVNNQTNH